MTACHPYPGQRIVVEGIDGSGKSTLLLVHHWLRAQRHKLFFTDGILRWYLQNSRESA